MEKVSVTITRVDWADPRAAQLRDSLDAEMTERYTGRHDDDPAFPEKARVAFSVDPSTIAATIIAVDEHGTAVGHAALRQLGERLEVKRVIVAPEARGQGLGRTLMNEIAHVAAGLGADSLILQTGDRQPDAVAMYERLGYRRIPVYEPYLPITNSICFEKQLD